MKKADYKKLALMGIMSGIVVATQASAAVAEQTSEGHILAYGCHGSGGCGGEPAPQAPRGSAPVRAYSAPSMDTAQPAVKDAKAQPQQNGKKPVQSDDDADDAKDQVAYADDPAVSDDDAGPAPTGSTGPAAKKAATM